MKELKQELAIGHKSIERLIKSNLEMCDYSKNDFVKSLKRQLEAGRPLTTNQKKALKDMDTMGKIRKAMKR